ncbi:hypothetical protein GCK72_007505 [Caenorhabditis remanei]|uniref:BTB domain-containing protein n=1 Tax=Caenorhabditis remanei TaxID=31234 RepID=A0A6A5HLI9_CAERE|nr:hypothetical protein GCK72_007505 [Caenorhabditis remanei]KAF1767546.1 hypothetical protein GCK72_007505 [Caenorhabditis remanei]
MTKVVQQRSDERLKPMEMKKQKITNNSSESVNEKVPDICQKLLEKQDNLEKSITEVVEKLRSAEEKIDKILQKREEDTDEKKQTEETANSIENPVTSPECSNEKSSQILPMTGKCFVLKHVFTNVQDVKEEVVKFGKEEEHFGVTWQVCLWKEEDDQLGLYLHCAKSLSDEKWLISSDAHFKLVSTNGKCHSELMSDTHGYTNGNTEFVAYGPKRFIEYNKMEEDFLEDDKLAVEIHVKIKEMTGIYKNDLKSFGDDMKSFSDVILVVNEKKFYVSKLYLAGHSPYFNSLLMGHFQESKKSEIKLTGIDADDFQNYLEILYGEHSIDEYTVEGILMVADMYETPLVIRKCEEFLLRKSKKTLKKKLQMSIRYNLDTLKKQCFSEIKSFADMKNAITGNIHDLDQPILAELLEKGFDLYSTLKMASGNIVKLDIGGTIFKTTKSTLTRFDGMLKVMIETEIPVEKDESGCIFVDRDPTHFRLILNFLRDGHVTLPDSEKEILEIQQEAQFYLLDGLMELCKRQLDPNIIKLNVGGTVFQTKKCMLKRFPSCFKLEKDEAGRIFIDRNPKHFPLILDFLRDGVVLPDDMKELREILKEANAYQVDCLVWLCNKRMNDLGLRMYSSANK